MASWTFTAFFVASAATLTLAVVAYLVGEQRGRHARPERFVTTDER